MPSTISTLASTLNNNLHHFANVTTSHHHNHHNHHTSHHQLYAEPGDWLATVIKYVFARITQPGGKWWWVHQLLAGGAVFYLLLNRLSRWYHRLRPKNPFLPLAAEDEGYDVCIVGAGPAGATCAYYLARRGRKVLLLDKKAFPRDKLCGDAVAPRAQKYLKEMNVLQEIIAEESYRKVCTGGIVSPSGESFIGNFTEEQVISIQRIVLDEKIVNAAERAGAILFSNTEVTSIKLNSERGVWFISGQTSYDDGSDSSSTSTNKEKTPVLFKARALVAADGATSRIARVLGVVTTPPNAVFGRCFAKAGTHNFRADNVLFYSKAILPGYFAINREPEDFLNLTCILIPGPPGSPKPEDLYRIYKDIVTTDPHITAALGPEVVLSPFQSCATRVGGVPKSYSERFLVVGDAAGHVDPLTGEGLQYGIEAGKIAAQTLIEGFEQGDLSDRFLKKYHQRWRRAFGWDFAVSSYVAEWFYACPALLDAAANVIRRNGEAFIAPWSLVRTGAKTKMWYLRPDVGPYIILVAILRVLFRRRPSVSSSSTSSQSPPSPSSSSCAPSPRQPISRQSTPFTPNDSLSPTQSSSSAAESLTTLPSS